MVCILYMYISGHCFQIIKDKDAKVQLLKHIQW